MRSAVVLCAVLYVTLVLTGGSALAEPPSISSYHIYFGHLHNHCNVSDGTGTADAAYNFAKNTAGLDFFGLADHGYQMSQTEYDEQVKVAANNYYVPGVYSTFYGVEWTCWRYHHGHVTVVHIEERIRANVNNLDEFDELLDWLDSHDCVAFLNHPGYGDPSVEFGRFTDTPVEQMVGMELWNGSSGFGDYYGDGYYSGDGGMGYYDEALLRDWKIGAMGSDDNHDATWGLRNDNRMAILANANTRADLYEAMKLRRFYATLDKNMGIYFEMDGEPMGAEIPHGSNSVVIKASDSGSENVTQVRLYKNGNLIQTWNPNDPLPVINHSVTSVAGDYFYCIVTQADGDEAISSPIFIYDSSADKTPPAAPTGLSATAGDNTADLDWDDNGEGDFDSYSLYRSGISGQGYVRIADDLASSNYLDTNLIGGTTYYYVVLAKDTSGNKSAYSSEVDATPTASPAPIDKTISLYAVENDKYLAINTGDNILYADQASVIPSGKFLVEDAGGTYVRLKANNGNYIRTNPTDKELPCDATTTTGNEILWEWIYIDVPNDIILLKTDIHDRHMRVDMNVPERHVDSTGGTGSWAQFVWAEVAGDTTPPAAPTGLAATPGDGSVSLDWNDNTEYDLANYTVYRYTTSGGPYDAVAADITNSDYVDTTVTNGITYYYVVTAVDTSDNESSYSSEVSALPEDTTPPAAPTGLVATPGAGTVSLDWNDNSEPDMASYTVYRSFTSGSGYVSIASGLTVSHYTDPVVHCGLTYYYVVTATDTSDNTSSHSNEDSAPTPSSPLGDITHDCHVDMLDLEKLSTDWLTDDADSDVAPPPAGDGIVNLLDLAVVAESWMAE